MNAITRISKKGQVVLPKSMRDRMGWASGTDLEVVERAGEITLKPVRRTKTLSVEEAVARLREIYQHKGPPVSLEQMKLDAAEMASGARRFK